MAGKAAVVLSSLYEQKCNSFCSIDGRRKSGADERMEIPIRFRGFFGSDGDMQATYMFPGRIVSRRRWKSIPMTNKGYVML
jgi:hypothetical protein